jgi:hypothetical protein
MEVCAIKLKYKNCDVCILNLAILPFPLLLSLPFPLFTILFLFQVVDVLFSPLGLVALLDKGNELECLDGLRPA